MLYTLLFFSSKCSLFHNANFFGSRIIHILYTGCAKIKKKNFGAKGLRKYYLVLPDTTDLTFILLYFKPVWCNYFNDTAVISGYQCEREM